MAEGFHRSQSGADRTDSSATYQEPITSLDYPKEAAVLLGPDAPHSREAATVCFITSATSLHRSPYHSGLIHRSCAIARVIGGGEVLVSQDSDGQP